MIHAASSIGSYAAKFVDLSAEELRLFTTAFKEIKVKKDNSWYNPIL